MNRPEEFDDLLRDKLQEREFPFEEAHWNDMQRVMAEEKRKKRRPILFFLLGAGLLGGIATWYTLSPSEDNMHVEHTSPATRSAGADEQPSSENTTVNVGPLQGQDRKAADREDGTVKNNVVPSANRLAERPDRSDVQDDQQQVSAPGTAALAVTSSPKGLPPDVRKTLATSGTVTEQTSVMNSIAVTPVPEAMGTAATVIGSTNDTSAPDVPVAALDLTTTEPDSVDDVLGTDTFADDLFALFEDLETRHPTKDTSISLSPDPLTTVPPTKAFVWQISGIGGVQRSFNDHGDVPFGTDHTPLNTGLGGAEIMRMGKNLGFGSGIHVLSYAEDIQRDEVYNDQFEFSTVFSLSPLSITVPGIVDTVLIGGDTYYVTTPVDTTILVLESEVDTSVTRIRTQEAERVRNVLSYVEIPLLLDGHVNCGNWTFGIRGGPTVALLTGRSGAVPQEGGSTLIPVEDAPFNTYSFGYMARLYVHYGLGQHWSIGLGPAIRGHFTPAISDAGYTIRPQAYGLNFSLTYLLK